VAEGGHHPQILAERSVSGWMGWKHVVGSSQWARQEHRLRHQCRDRNRLGSHQHQLSCPQRCHELERTGVVVGCWQEGGVARQYGGSSEH